MRYGERGGGQGEKTTHSHRTVKNHALAGSGSARTNVTCTCSVTHVRFCTLVILSIGGGGVQVRVHGTGRAPASTPWTVTLKVSVLEREVMVAAVMR